MNTLHLKYIVEVEKAGSITLAAEKLYMNQPNLSKAIKEFEASIGIDIFKRTSKGIVPTPKGEKLLSHAKNILAQIEEMESLSKTDKKRRVSFSLSAPGASYISYAFTSFINKLDTKKDLDIKYIETSSMKTINNVAEGEYHLGIVRYHKDYESYFISYLKENGLQYEDIWEFEFLALMSKNNPVASADSIYNENLNKCIEIVNDDLAVPHYLSADIKKAERKQTKKSRIYVFDTGSQFDLLSQIAGSYMLVSPLPQQQLEKYGLIQRKCSKSNQIYKDILIYRERHKSSEINRVFIEELNRIKDSICSTY